MATLQLDHQLMRFREWRGRACDVGLELSRLCHEHSISDMVDLARRFDVEVEHIWLPSRRNFSGAAFPFLPRPFIIVNNANDLRHQQFTIVHELAHILLGHTESPKAEFQAQMVAFMVLYGSSAVGDLFDMLDDNPDVEMAMAYAWFPEIVLLGTPCMETILEYIDSVKSE